MGNSERMNSQSHDSAISELKNLDQINALLKATRYVLEYKNFKETAYNIFTACKELIGATAGYFAQLGVVGEYFRNIALAIGIFAAPAAGLLAIRAIWDAGKTEDLEKVIPKIPNK